MKKNQPEQKDLELREFHSSSNGIFFKIKKILFSGKTPFQKIEIFENENFGRVLFLDGLVQTTEKDEFFYHEMLVHPALMSHPKPKKILIIGGGDGGALKEVLRYPIEKVWLVEIDSQVIETSKEFFPWLDSALQDKRAKLVISDGNDFIRETGEKFDVILIDSSDPEGPSTVLHQKAFYELIKKGLKPKGVVAAQAGALLYHLEQHKAKYSFLKRLFKISCFYIGPAPTYPGGIWCYVFLSDEIDPLADIKKNPPSGLKYYNLEIHRAAFALPNFLKKQLS
jgi:spermidine synthase